VRKTKKRGEPFKAWFVGLVTVIVIGGGMGVVKSVEAKPVHGVAVDGDTIQTNDGKTFRLLGVNAPEKGSDKYEIAKGFLNTLIENKNLYLEADRVEKDRYGRELFWVWINCEKRPLFLPNKYMEISPWKHNEPLKKNPEGCKKGSLVNEEIIKAGLSDVYFLQNKGEMKYEELLFEVEKKRKN